MKTLKKIRAEIENLTCDYINGMVNQYAVLQIIDKYAEQEPSRKTGQWIEKDGFDGDVYYDCSECGESWTTIEGTPWQNGMAYCPNCGADMRGAE